LHGTFTAFGAGCRSSTGTITQSARGHPDIGTQVNYLVSGGPASGPVLCALGFSRTNWSGIPLPFAVTAAPGCFIYNEMVIAPAFLTDRTGAGGLTLGIANDQSLVGGHYYTQMWGIDLTANPLGVTFSNAIDTMIGGDQ
jgi:hypothetical protein